MKKLLSVTEASQILETEPTNVYALVRAGILEAVTTEPIQIKYTQIIRYLNNRLPSTFSVSHNEHEQLDMVA